MHSIPSYKGKCLKTSTGLEEYDIASEASWWMVVSSQFL